MINKTTNGIVEAKTKVRNTKTGFQVSFKINGYWYSVFATDKTSLDSLNDIINKDDIVNVQYTTKGSFNNITKIELAEEKVEECTKEKDIQIKSINVRDNITLGQAKNQALTLLMIDIKNIDSLDREMDFLEIKYRKLVKWFYKINKELEGEMLSQEKD